MKKLSNVQIVALLFITSFFALSSSGGLDDSLSGHPSDIGTCANCHSGNSSAGNIILSGSPSSFTPGQVYPLTLTLNDVDAVNGGFQIVAVGSNSNNTQVGTFQNIPSNTRFTPSGRLTHNSPANLNSGTVSWTFNWRAPTTSPPPSVTFYYAVNAVDGTGDTSGDQVRTGVSVSIPLPVELLTFDAIRKSEHIQFNWSTSVEINTESFEIQSSDDGISFETIDRIRAEGNSNKLQFYSTKSYTDLQANYFRLKMIDFDGSFAFSKIVFIKSKPTTPIVRLVSGMIEIDLHENQSVNLSIYDLSGRTLISETTPEIERWIIDASNFHKGVYIVNVVGSNTERFVEKIVVQ